MAAGSFSDGRADAGRPCARSGIDRLQRLLACRHRQCLHRGAEFVPGHSDTLRDGGFASGRGHGGIIPDTVAGLRRSTSNTSSPAIAPGWRALHALANAFGEGVSQSAVGTDLYLCRRWPALTAGRVCRSPSLPAFSAAARRHLLNHILQTSTGLRSASSSTRSAKSGSTPTYRRRRGQDGRAQQRLHLLLAEQRSCRCRRFGSCRRDQRIDYLVVECTGLADPLPIVLTFLRPELRDRVRVDSIVTIADAANFSLDLFASKRPKTNCAMPTRFCSTNAIWPRASA